MSEQARDLEKTAFGISAMYGIYWLYYIFIRQRLSASQILESLIGLLFLYVVGLTLFIFISKSDIKYRCGKNKISAKLVLQCFLLQFSAFMLNSLFMLTGTAIKGKSPDTTLQATSPYMLFMLLVFSPLAEEFVFRYLFASKLLKHGERMYILVSSFCFAIVHAVPLGLTQTVYTFILGMIWSYLFVKSGKLILTIVLHALSNLFGSVMLQTLFGISSEAAYIYSVFLMLLGVMGLVLLWKNRKKINLDGRGGLIDKNTLKDMMTNKGIIAYLLLALIMMFLKTAFY